MSKDEKNNKNKTKKEQNQFLLSNAFNAYNLRVLGYYNI